MKDKIRSICIFGPTASGKSALALRLARDLGGTIISADSMQIYRGMDVGTAKPSKEERDLVPHKMIDVCGPNERFSVYQYQEMAREEIQSAHRNGSCPIVVGGTGLYVDALLNNTDFGEIDSDAAVHEKLLKRFESEGGAALLSELSAIDPETAKPLHEKDAKRILRALEVYYSTGRTLTSFKEESHTVKNPVSYLCFNLCFHDRQRLYDRIDRRVDEMLEKGLIQETKRLFFSGETGQTASQAIGYKELFPYIKDEEPLDSCVALLKQRSRNYAKRQITWFKRYVDAVPLWMDGENDPYTILKERSLDFLKS